MSLTPVIYLFENGCEDGDQSGLRPDYQAVLRRKKDYPGKALNKNPLQSLERR
jgi:hypothetical protein